jgi:predicted nucleic acid-binding protein
VIFVDTGAFDARYRKADDHHRESLAGWREIGLKRTSCLTTSLVVAETVTLIGRDFGGQVAAVRAAAIYGSAFITIARSGTKDELDALSLLRKYSDQRAQFVDCVSFVMMRRFNLKNVFGFDRHFELAGFELWPGKK